LKKRFIGDKVCSVAPPSSFRGLSDFGKSGHQHVLKAVVIYEDIVAGVRAPWFCQRLACALDCALEEKMWNFHVLGIREIIRNSSVGAARRADILIVSVSGYTTSPGTVLVWLDMWLSLLTKKKPALVGLSRRALRGPEPAVRRSKPLPRTNSSLSIALKRYLRRFCILSGSRQCLHCECSLIVLETKNIFHGFCVIGLLTHLLELCFNSRRRLVNICVGIT